MKAHLRLAIALLCSAAATPAWCASGELKTAAKKIFSDNQQAVVWVSVISKMTVTPVGDLPAGVRPNFGNDKERKREVRATLIDPSGLLVTSLGAVDNSSLMDGQEVNTPQGRIKLRTSSEIKEVKVTMADGTEIPADIVLKDADLDLAFIRLRMDSKEAKGIELKPVDVKNNVRAEPLDDVIGVSRMEPSMNSQAAVFTTEVMGITRKPREFLRIPTDSIGCPLFATDGKLIGIAVIRKSQSEGGNLEAKTVVLPAADIVKISAQAREAQPPSGPESAEKKSSE